MNTDVPELRDYATTLELRDVQAVGAGRPYQYLEGRAVPYDTWADVGWFMEQHRRGSFKRSTDRARQSGKPLPLTLFHDKARFPIGHAERWEHTPDGMVGVWKLNDSPDAQTAARMAEAGDMVGLSVGFTAAEDPVIDELGPDGRLRVTHVQSRLIEVSMTPAPAYTDAAVTMVRTRITRPAPVERAVDQWRRDIDRLRSRVN